MCVTHWLAAPGRGPGTRVSWEGGPQARCFLPSESRRDCRQAPGPHFLMPAGRPCAFHQLWWQCGSDLLKGKVPSRSQRRLTPVFGGMPFQF